jgi:hypothetical protein
MHWRGLQKSLLVIVETLAQLHAGNGPKDTEVGDLVSFTPTKGIDWATPYIDLQTCIGIRTSIGTENPIPKEVNHRKISIRVPVMNKV